MSSPEALVKAKVRKTLADYEGMYVFMPVPSGYGRTTLDFIGCYRRRFFAIETKAPGKKPTLRQATELKSIDRAMGRTFVIDDVESPVLDELRAWLDDLTENVGHDINLTPDPVRRRPI
jgi:hypothetical protein